MEAPQLVDFLNPRERYRVAKSRTLPTHKFAVGARVVHMIGVRAERISCQVTRQLPDGGDGLQYRIRSDRDGQERVVLESTLQRSA